MTTRPRAAQLPAYPDTGCDLGPETAACVDCPLPECRYVVPNPDYTAAWRLYLALQRGDDVEAVARRYQVTPDRIDTLLEMAAHRTAGEWGERGREETTMVMDPRVTMATSANGTKPAPPPDWRIHARAELAELIRRVEAVDELRRRAAQLHAGLTAMGVVSEPLPWKAKHVARQPADPRPNADARAVSETKTAVYQYWREHPTATPSMIAEAVGCSPKQVANWLYLWRGGCETRRNACGGAERGVRTHG